MKKRKLSARRRVRTGSALFLCAFSLAGLTLTRLLASRLGGAAWLHTLGALLFIALPAFLGLLVIDGDQSHLIPPRALSGAQTLWLALTGVLAVCPMTLLADVLSALAGRFAAPLASAAGGGESALLPLLLRSAVLAPLCEELFFRGYLQGTLSRYGAVRACVAAALLFALAHGLSMNLPCYALLGLMLGALTLRTGSVLAPLLVHMAYNAALALLAACGLGALMTGLAPLSCLLRLIGCAGFAYALRRAFAARGTRMAPDGALRVDMQALLSMLAAVLAVVAAQLIAEVLS